MTKRKEARYFVDWTDGQWTVWDCLLGAVSARFPTAPTRDLALRGIVGTLAEVGLGTKEIASLTDGLSIAHVARMLKED